MYLGSKTAVKCIVTMQACCTQSSKTFWSCVFFLVDKVHATILRVSSMGNYVIVGT